MSVSAADFHKMYLAAQNGLNKKYDFEEKMESIFADFEEYEFQVCRKFDFEKIGVEEIAKKMAVLGLEFRLIFGVWHVDCLGESHVLPSHVEAASFGIFSDIVIDIIMNDAMELGEICERIAKNNGFWDHIKNSFHNYNPRLLFVAICLMS